MNADFQLRHTTVRRHGSFWGSKTDANTTGKLRALSKTAAVASRLQHIDTAGAYALGAQKMIKEDVIIDFRDGHFAVTGPDMQSYVPVMTDVNGVYEMLRSADAPGVSGSTPRPHRLSSMTDAEVASMVADVPALDAVGTWFLIPKPADINPIILTTVKTGVTLVYGVDFFTSKHFIITQHAPAEYFAPGAILASLVEVYLDAFDSYTSDSPRSKKGRKWVNTFTKRSQSMELFRRAAAEFCGLYVLPEDDVVLNVLQLPDNSCAYAFADAGVIVVDYDHTPLTPGTIYRAGHVVCDQFELRSQATHGDEFLTSSAAPIDLSGIYGMTVQLPADGMVACSYAYTNIASIPHLRLYYGGTLQNLELVWALQMMHENLTGNSLATVLGGGLDDVDTFPDGIDFPPMIDAAEMLTSYYGRRLFLLVVDGLPESYEFELDRFIRDNTPTGAFLLRADIGAPVIDPPTVVPPPSLGNALTYEGNALTYEGVTLTYS